MVFDAVREGQQLGEGERRYLGRSTSLPLTQPIVPLLKQSLLYTEQK